MTIFSVPANLAFGTYSELIAAINDWLDRSDLSGAAPQMIALCEARLRRELNPLFSETSVDVTVTQGVGSLPDDCDIIRLIEYNGGELEQVSAQHGRQFRDSDAPRVWTLEANQIKTWPATDCTITVLYQPKLVALNESNPTNQLLAEHPDLYFFGALLFAHGYVSNDPRAATFKALWDECIAEVKRFLARQRKSTTRMPNPAVIA